MSEILRDDDERPSEAIGWLEFVVGALFVPFVDLLIGASLWAVPATLDSMGASDDVTAWLFALAATYTVGVGFIQVLFIAPLVGLTFIGGRRKLAAGLAAGMGLVFLLIGCLQTLLVGTVAAFCASVA